jgi:DNA recombination protein RmuC
MEIALVAAVVALIVVVLVLALRRPGTPAATPSGAVAPTIDPEAFLAPIREQLQSVTRQLQDTQMQATERFTSVEGVLRNIAAQNAELHRQGMQLGEATVRISTALQGTGVAGDWGEMQLRRTVELAGLTEHVSFVEQETVRTDDGQGRPDLIVRLPQDRHVIVDAKAPLVDFDGTADAAATQANALKRHVTDLSQRNYSAYHQGALDFVVLFVPTEGILATALGHDPTLSEFAIGRRVLLATPMTLLAMLRAVQYGWLQVASAENAQQIVADAIKLFDRLATFTEHLERVGNGLGSAIKHYNSAVGSLQSSVRPQAVRMREHGLTVTKDLADIEPIDTEPRALEWG